MSVWLWNLKMVGPKKQESTYSRENFFKQSVMNYGSSKSAKIVLSKSIFNVKNQLNFLRRNLGLGQIYWSKGLVAHRILNFEHLL